MSQHHSLDDGEAQSGSTQFPGTGRVDPVEAFEDPVQVSGVDADSAVLNHQERLLSLLAQADRDLAPLGCVLEGVSHQVRGHQAKAFHVAGDPHGPVRDSNVELDAPNFRRRNGFFRRNGNRISQVDDFPGDTLLGLHSGQRQEVGHDGGEPERLVPGLPKEPVSRLKGHVRVIQDRFHESLDGCYGRLEFVGDVGHEILPHGLDPQPLRDVVQHHHGSRRRLVTGAKRRGLQLDGAVSRGRPDFQAGVHAGPFTEGFGNGL